MGTPYDRRMPCMSVMVVLYVLLSAIAASLKALKAMRHESNVQLRLGERQSLSTLLFRVHSSALRLGRPE